MTTELAPIVYIIFNRLDCIRKTFPAIRNKKPEKLFIISDGPRSDYPDDSKKVQDCRDFIDTSIDWGCEVHRLYHEGNLGCGINISSGLNWVFSQVDLAIILEDDILPDPSFFQFCETLLELYKNEKRIFSITGRNHFGTWDAGGKPYFFTYNLSSWGWATWRRAWAKYNFTLEDWGDVRNRFRVLLNLKSFDYFLGDYFLFNGLFHNPRHDTWLYQWYYTCLKNGGLTIMPNQNLTAHIGMGDDATHLQDWKESIKVTTFTGDFPKYNLLQPDHNFQNKILRKLKLREKFKLIIKLLKNEIKFFLNLIH
jgi:hypothetical protein